MVKSLHVAVFAQVYTGSRGYIEFTLCNVLSLMLPYLCSASTL